jgi:hypothetical protein
MESWFCLVVSTHANWSILFFLDNLLNLNMKIVYHPMKHAKVSGLGYKHDYWMICCSFVLYPCKYMQVKT